MLGTKDARAEGQRAHPLLVGAPFLHLFPCMTLQDVAMTKSPLQLPRNGFSAASGVCHAGREAYHVNPFRWRGDCFGRTCSECFWVGIHPTRWARAAYGGDLGGRFRDPPTLQRRVSTFQDML